MATYKLLTGTHSRWIGDKKTGRREDYNAYDTDKNLMEDLTDEEIKSLGSRIVRVYQSGEVVEGKEGVEEVQVPHVAHVTVPENLIVGAPVPNTSPATTPAAPVESDLTVEELLSKNIPEIEAEIATIIDVVLLDTIQQEEIKGKGRAGVFKAIESRKGELRNK